MSIKFGCCGVVALLCYVLCCVLMCFCRVSVSVTCLLVLTLSLSLAMTVTLIFASHVVNAV